MATNEKPPVVAPEPKPTPPMEKQWSCKIEVPDGLTVGVRMTANCEGESIALDRANLKIVNRDDFKYALRLLEVKSLTDNRAELIVTSWVAGELKIPNPALTDDVHRVGMGDQTFAVTSVIDPASNPEGKPFPPLVPISIAWPIWVWLIVAAFAALMASILGLAVRRSLKRKRLLNMLDQHASALSPFNHFTKELRRHVKTIPIGANAVWSPVDSRAFFEALDKDFRWFLSRELVIPAIEGAPARIVSEVKRADRDVWDLMKRDLRVALNELQTATKEGGSVEDAQQLAELCRTLADRIAKERSA